MTLDADFSLLYHKYKNRTYGYVYYFCGDRALAEEICQDVFLKVYLNIGKFEGRSSFKTWIYRITRNTYLDYVSARNKGLSPSDSEEVLEDLPTRAAGPEEQVLNTEVREQIVKTLGRLSDRYRTLIILREIQHLSYQEISEVTGMEVNAVKVGLYRARREFAGVKPYPQDEAGLELELRFPAGGRMKAHVNPESGEMVMLNGNSYRISQDTFSQLNSAVAGVKKMARLQRDKLLTRPLESSPFTTPTHQRSAPARILPGATQCGRHGSLSLHLLHLACRKGNPMGRNDPEPHPNSCRSPGRS